MTEKTCSKCNVTKNIECFSNSKRGEGGKKSTCKECASNYYKEWYSEKYNTDASWRESLALKASQWAKENPEKRSKIAIRRNKKALESNPEKVKARALVNQRVRFGRMPRASTQKCAHCENQAQHYHHYKGYSFENRYDVQPVCCKCHALLG